MDIAEPPFSMIAYGSRPVKCFPDSNLYRMGPPGGPPLCTWRRRSGGCRCVGDRGPRTSAPPGRSTVPDRWGTFTFGPGVVVAGYVTRQLEDAGASSWSWAPGAPFCRRFWMCSGAPRSFRRFPTWPGPVPARAWRSGGDPGAPSARQWGSARPTVSFARSRSRWASSSSGIGSTPAAWRRAVRRLRFRGSGVLRGGSLRGLAHDATDGLVLLRSSPQRRVPPATGHRHDSSLLRCAVLAMDYRLAWPTFLTLGALVLLPRARALAGVPRGGAPRGCAPAWAAIFRTSRRGSAAR